MTTATIITSGFSDAAEAHCKLLQRPALAYFVVPHPIVSKTEDELRACVDAIFDGLVHAISGTEAGRA